jgi:integrase
MASIREHVSTKGERTWKVLYRHGGKQSSTSFVVEKKAERFKILVETLGPDGALRVLAEESTPVGVTLRELAAEWLDWKARDVQPRTITDYRRDFDNWIDPFMGHRAAGSITEMDVQAWVDRDLSRRLGAKSVADRHALLHGIYKWASAKSRARVPSNPCIGTELPKRSSSDPKGLTMPEWLALKEASRTIPGPGAEDAADLLLFLASTGWRIGEATALTVRSVEDDGRKMHVTMSQVNRKGVGLAQGGKSMAAMRRIDVNSECAAMIRRRLVGKGSSDLVFTNAASPVAMWEPSTFRKRYWSKMVKAAGLEERRPTPHWMRHTHVMLCHAAGMSLPEIQRRIGHEDIKTTINVYGRKLGEVSDEVMDKLDLLLSGKAAPVLGVVVHSALE